MTLLAPLAALGVLGLAGPALVALYFLKLRRKPIRVGSIMLWEQAARDVQVNVPFRMIRPSWLLLLHLLALALAALTVGRPAMETDSPAADRVVIVLDASASMSAAGDDGRTRLEQAKETAIELAERAGRAASRPSISVVSMAADAVLIEQAATSVRAAEAAIASIEQTDQRGEPARAARLIETLVSASATEANTAPRVLVHVVSDGGDIDGRSGMFVRGAVVERHTVPASRAVPLNVGVTAFSAARDFEEPAVVRVFARVESNAGRPLAVTAQLLLDDAPVGSTVFAMPAASGDTAEAVWSTSVRAPSGGVLSLALDRADALASDNRAWLAVGPVRRPAILVAAGPEGPDEFLMAVLGALDLRVLRVATDPASEVPAAAGRGFDAIVLDGFTPASEPPLPTLSFGVSPVPLPDADQGSTGFEAFAGGPAAVLAWDRSSPIVREAGLASILVGGSIPLRASPGFDVLATGPSGPLIVARRDEPRRVAVGFPLRATTWPLDVGFPIFLAAAVEYLTAGAGGDTGSGIAWSTSEPATLPTGRDGPFDLIGPSGTILRQDLEPVEGAVACGVLPRSGVYVLRSGERDIAVPVNVADSGETSLRVRGTSSGPARPDTPAGEAGTAAARQRVELWPWALTAFLVVMTIEWIVFAARARG